MYHVPVLLEESVSGLNIDPDVYALSGFAVYNVFFNHFVDVVALFPYLLWALDEAMYTVPRLRPAVGWIRRN